MKQTALTLAFLLMSTPAFAQFGQIIKRAEQAKKISEANISEKDERAIGEQVSSMLVDRFGVYQDAAVTKYVTLVGSVLAQASTRPGLEWRFIVLDSEGVNAYAAPGGLVHITKGALGLIKSEAELAGVLGHEITHITEKHTINAISKSKLVDVGTDELGSQTGGLTGTVINAFADRVYADIFENKYDRSDENESDEEGIILANKVGYSPKGMSEFLNHIAERNKGMQQPNGVFASHPQLKDRLAKLEKVIKDKKLNATATVQARYASNITFDAKPLAEIAALDVEGVKGAVGGGSSESKEDAKKEEEKPKKKGFGLGSVTSSLAGGGGGKQQNSTQAASSAGARGVGPDTGAIGGSNKNRVKVTISATEVTEFKKGIA